MISLANTGEPLYIVNRSGNRPEGWRSHEIYVQGLSTSLPPDVQVGVVNAIPGME